MKEPCIILSGTGNAPLAAAVAAELGVSLGPCTIERFPDGELAVELGDSVRGREIYLLQPTAPPANDHIMELLLIGDACRRSAADRIVAFVPYFGCARSDRRGGRRTPITASLVAELLMTVGIDQVVMVDVHAPQALVAATHGLLVAGARERLAAAGGRELFVTDTVPVTAGGVPDVHVVSVAPLLARAIEHLRSGTSLRGLA